MCGMLSTLSQRNEAFCTVLQILRFFLGIDRKLRPCKYLLLEGLTEWTRHPDSAGGVDVRSDGEVLERGNADR